MKVTVLMTYYNKGRFVEEAVRSVLDSTFSDFELLVVDDASTDNGLDRIRALSDPRIRILESAVNMGRPAAANRGIEAARGEYIAVLDADDRMLPHRLERQVAFMDAHQEIGISGSALRTIATTSQFLNVRESDAEARVLFLYGMPVYYSSSIIRRQLLMDNNIRCDTQWLVPGMDRLFLLELSRYTLFANLPEVLTEYRKGESNMRHGRDPWHDNVTVVAEVLRLLGVNTLPDAPELLCHLKGMRVETLDAATLRRIRALIKDLRAKNRKGKWFHQELLEKDLARRWYSLYAKLPDSDPHAALTHTFLTRPLPKARLRYQLVVRAKRFLGLSV